MTSIPHPPANDPNGPLAALEHVSVGGPITRAGVTLVPVYVQQPLPGSVVTGIDALIGISEDDDEAVPSLTVTSRSDHHVLMVEGETVAGGLQQRSLNVSVLVPPRATLRVPVSCVESGRWSGGREFVRGRSHATSRVRMAKHMSVNDSMRNDRSKFSDQHRVWAAVDEDLDRLAAPAPTRNLADADAVLDQDGRRFDAVRELTELGPLAGQCGVVVFHGRHLVGTEILGSPELFGSLWAPMVRAHVLDAPEDVEGRPSVGRALRFVRRLAAGRATVAPGVGAGQERHVRTPRLVGQVLSWDSAVLHASAFALAA